MTVIFISRAGKQLGQFNEAEVSEGLTSGRFLTDDLAWKEGMAEWKPLGTFGEFGGSPSWEASSIPPITQRAISPLAPTGKVDVGLCFSRAWETYKTHFGLCLVATLVYFAISCVLQAPGTVTQMGLESLKGRADAAMLVLTGGGIMIFFMVLQSAVSMILTGGLMYFYINTLRSGPNFKDLFAGFRPPLWWKILLAGTVWTLGFVAAALLTILPGVLLSVWMKNQTILIPFGGIFALVAIYLSVAIVYAFPLIIDRNLGPIEGLLTSVKTVHTQWWQVFALFIILIALTILGMLACCVGMIFTIPLAYLVLAEGYRQLFGDPGVER